jgi:hypothetical protein
MRIWLGVALAGAMLFSLANGGNIVQAKDPPDGTRHASLQAYPDATVSATDTASGITVSVGPDGSTLTARDAAGAVLWHADVLKQTGKPSAGFPVVRNVMITAHGTVSLIIGKNRVVEADLKSGALKLMGED